MKIVLKIRSPRWWLLAILLLCLFVPFSGQSQNKGEYEIGTASGKYHFKSGEVPGSLVELHSPVAGSSGLVYIWYSSTHPTTGFTTAAAPSSGKNYNVSSPLTQTMYYRRVTIGTGVGIVGSNTIKLALVAPDWEDLNYSGEYEIRTPGISTVWEAKDLPLGARQQVTAYTDGLGRPLERISKGGATPGDGNNEWGDVVEFSRYDEYGREPKQYLPYSTTTALGKYKTAPLTEQPPYYSSVLDESSAYSAATYDNSPLNRVLELHSPGSSWASSAGNSVSYLTNEELDSVQMFSVDDVPGSPPVHEGAYEADMLYKFERTDENGNKVVEYADKSGRLILRKIQAGSLPYSGTTGWISVYSVYDDFGRLRYLLQPEAVRYLSANGWSFSGTGGQQILEDQCFRYSYDDKGRVISQKAPGKEAYQVIYDIRDREVFTQQGNQAALTVPEWTVTLYDELDRPSLVGLYHTTKTREQLQADVDNAVDTQNVVISHTETAVNDLEIDHRDPSVSTYKARNSITFLPGFEVAAGDAFTAEIDPNATIDSVLTAQAIVLHDPISESDLNNPAITTILKYEYYDDYDYAGVKGFSSGFTNTAAYSGADVLPVAATGRTKGYLTGSKTRVTGTNDFLMSTYYYDEKGNPVQLLRENFRGGTDITTFQYHFDGRLLSVDERYNNPSGDVTDFQILTKYVFDKIGRVSGIEKKWPDSAWKELSSYEYDDLGRLQSGTLSPGYGSSGLETLHYSYNIHSQLTGMNKDYALKTPGKYDASSHYFGFYLGYDNGDNVFSSGRLDGKVSGEQWNSRSDGTGRKYDYDYDPAGRLRTADFQEEDGSGWSNSAADYTVNNVEYDLNGNLQHLSRYGVKEGNSQKIDELSYEYGPHSNRLKKVTDAVSDPQTRLGDFHDGPNTTGDDYAYDANGNLVEDGNKSIGSITYNYLNQPEEITFTGKGNIRFVYDADGNKVQKIVTDNTVSPAKITTTDYLSGAVYRNDTLQYLPTEEGRIRWVPAYQGDPGYWVWDYFVRDHLGNVRMVLTEQTDFSQYLATMETGEAAKEEALFYNLDGTRTPRPMDYPEDQITTPNASVARLNGRDPAQRIGPSIILKVMAGDTIEAAVRAYYRQEKEPQRKATIPAEQLLTGLVQALVAPQGAAMAAHGRQALGADPQSAGLTAKDLQQLRDRYPQTPEEDKPKGYLNYVFFDNNLNFVEEGSGAKGIESEGGELETLASGKIGVKRSGYVYVFTSNESEEEVFFDNFGVTQVSGPVLEETHYYPFGLVMAGISTEAPLKLANEFKYNGKELNEREFSDGTGLEWYSYGYREYDPQIARFPQLDPLTHDYPFLTPYQYASNDPIANIDLDGLEGFNILPFSREIGGFIGPSLSGVTISAASTGASLAGSAASTLGTIASLAGSAASMARNIGEMTSGGTISNYQPNFYDKWSESGNLFAEASYSLVDNAWVTMQSFMPFKGNVFHLNRELATNNERVNAFVGTTSDAVLSFVGGQAFTGIRASFIGRSAAKTSTSLVTKYPANAAIAGTAERTFLMPGQVIDRYGALGGKWFSTPGTSYGARSIPPGLSPYTQFKVLKPFEVQKSLASPGMFSGQTGFGIQFQSPVGADILIKRGIIAPF